jgi:hypothetical protein
MASLETGTRPSPTMETAAFDALGHVFAVSSEDPRLGDLVDRSFAALTTERKPTGWYAIHRADDGRLDVGWKGKRAASSADRASAFAWLRWDVNRRAVAAADGDLVLHAGCVARGEGAILVSGPPGAGKSTLVAALVARGLTYLADEALPVDLVTARVRAFPGPMMLDDHSLELLPEVAPLRVPRVTTELKHTIIASRRPPAAESAARDVTIVLFPERDPSGLTAVQPVGRAETVVRLAQHSFNLPTHGHAAIDVLSRVASHAPAFRVVGDDPHAAADAVIEALDAL